MQEKLCITKDTGEVLNVELVSMFSISALNKRFVITTSNEIDPNGLVKLHVSEIKNNKLYKIELEEDWSAIKTVMRSIISSSAGDFNYLASIQNVKAVPDYTRGIAVQIVAKEQLANDYEQKRPLTDDTPQTNEEKPIPMEPSTPVMTTTDFSVPNGVAVAPGIIETPVEKETTSDPVIMPPEENLGGNSGDDTAVVELKDLTPETVEEAPIDPSVLVTEEKTTTPIVDINLSQKDANTPIVNVTPLHQNPQPVVNNQQAQNQNQMTPDMNMFQQMFTQMMQQMGMVSNTMPNQMVNQPQTPVSTPESVPFKLTDQELEKIVSDAREVFIESAKNLADVIISNVQEKIKAKEDELAKKEIILSQREAAINQQTMANFNQTNQGS